MSTRINIVQGEYAVSKNPDALISTLLGSCISVCLYQPSKGIGGMNHFLLPGERTGAKLGLGERHGAYLMELLINGLLKQGVAKSELLAKVFGGAQTVAFLGDDIGERNISFARQFLKEEQIPIISESVGGKLGRRIQFWPATGKVMQSFIPPPPEQLPPPLKLSSVGGDLELF